MTVLCNFIYFAGTSVTSDRIVPVRISYDRKRSGNDMMYKFKFEVSTPENGKTHAEPIYLYGIDCKVKRKQNGMSEEYQVFRGNPDNGYPCIKPRGVLTWSDPIVYTTDWLRVQNIRSNGDNSTEWITMQFRFALNTYMDNYGKWVFDNIELLGPESTSLDTWVEVAVSPDISVLNLPSSLSYIGSPITLTVTKYDTNYRHTLTAEIWSYNESRLFEPELVIRDFILDTSITWTPDLSMTAYDIENQYVIVKYKLITWLNSTTEIGTNTYVSRLYVPVKDPVINNINLNITSDNEIVRNWGIALNGHFKLNWSIDAETFYNARIYYNYLYSSYHGTIGTESSGTSKNLKYNISSSSETYVDEFWSKVFDSRGRSDSTEDNKQQITVYGYTPPKIESADAFRCNEDGTKNLETGEYMYVICSGIIDSVGGRNAISVRCKYKRAGVDSEYTVVDLQNGVAMIIPNIALSDVYEINLIVEDLIGESDNRTFMFTPGEVTFHMRNDGLGIGFGKYCAHADKRGNAIQDVIQSAWTFEGTNFKMDNTKLSYEGADRRSEEELDLLNIGSNIVYHDHQTKLLDEPGKWVSICSVNITKPGNYICLGSIEGDGNIGSQEMLYEAEIGKIDSSGKSVLWSTVTRSVSSYGGGCMALAYLRVPSIEDSNSVTVVLNTANCSNLIGSAQSYNYTGNLICIRLDDMITGY